jgi:hypothetical protein
MRSLFRRLLPGAARDRSLRIHKISRLLFERLDARKLMAADAVEPVEETVADVVVPAAVVALPADDVAVPAAEALPLKLGATVIEAGAGSPLWGEVAPGGIGKQAMMSGNSAYGGYGGYGFIPPEILDFDATQTTPGMWTFTGRVIDDEGVHGLIVEFGGLLEGESTMVRADGTFELTILLDPNVVGIATATTTDWDGIMSQEVEAAVG